MNSTKNAVSGIISFEMQALTGIAVALGLLAFCSVCFGDVDPKDFLRREHSLVKPYMDNLWDIAGNAMITNNFVRLTPADRSKQGAIWNKIPVFVTDWEMHVHFKIHGTKGALFGDGIAIWYAKDRLNLGPVFGSVDKFKGLAIFLDTYSNHNGPHHHSHPYISAMINNGTLSYDHDTDGTHTQIAGCESGFRDLKQETYVAIRYAGTTLTVSTDIEGKGNWKRCFKVEGVTLPTGYYVGASAATGDLFDFHDLYSIKFYELDVPEKRSANIDYSKLEPAAAVFEPPREHVEDKPSFSQRYLHGWRLVLFILLIIVALGVCGGVFWYMNQQRSGGMGRKRFY